MKKTVWNYYRTITAPVSYGRASERREYGFIGTTAYQTYAETYSYADFGSTTQRTTEKTGPGYTERFIRNESPPPATFPLERWPQPNSTTYRYLIAGGTTTQVGEQNRGQDEIVAKFR